ncbi:MAG: polyprenyl synthetase family protein [Calditrichaeota bacterium]|nr:polyprenyl synthetase family protein [Calditrichota bacterium]
MHRAGTPVLLPSTASRRREFNPKSKIQNPKSKIQNLKTYQSIISTDLDRFHEAYRAALLSGHPVIDKVIGYLVRTHGKGIRPTLALLCGSLGGRPPDETCLKAAVVVELLHEATLVHDDVVDEAEMRRGWPSLPATFKNKVSVLFGDYMLAQALALTLEARDLKWLDVLSATARRMARGELLQAARSRRLNLTEPEYMQMISDKTAALFSAACQLGGLTSGLPEEQVQRLSIYGEKLGLAFQIHDDLLDLFGDDTALGKPRFGDIKERKLTLPLIKALAKAKSSEGRRIRARIRRGIKPKELYYIIDFIRRYQGDSKAVEVMRQTASEACCSLDMFPATAVKQILQDLTIFVITRSK